MRVLLTRPHEETVALAELLLAHGIDAIAAPLLEIDFITGDALDMNGVQGVVFTSANAVRAFVRRCDERDLPALCVGDATARAARAGGFSDIQSASGDVNGLAALIKATCDPDAGALVHPAGTKLAGDLGGQLEAAGFTYRRETLYVARKAQTLPDSARRALEDVAVDGVLLYSPRTAEAFCKLVAAAQLSHKLATVTAYCLSAAVAHKILHCPWRAVEIARTPDQDALLALLRTHSPS